MRTDWISYPQFKILQTVLQEIHMCVSFCLNNSSYLSQECHDNHYDHVHCEKDEIYDETNDENNDDKEIMMKIMMKTMTIRR